MEGIIAVTYRCNSKCDMCHTWQYPTKKQEELEVRDVEKLPPMSFANVTGGEPFLRDDLADIVGVVKAKCRRMVISTNGLLTDKIIGFAEKNKDVGLRVSLEGLSDTSDALRGVDGGFDQAFRTLIRLKGMGLKDLGMAMTVSDKNAHDLIDLFRLSKAMDVEFAIAVVHNSYYFHKMDNEIREKDRVAGEFRKLIREYLGTGKVKNWFRAYMATGLINRVYGLARPLPCDVATAVFFLDPFGEVRPCNVMEESMGNIKKQSFEQIWNGRTAQQVREKVRTCPENCWMIGSVSGVMKKKIWVPIRWIIRNKWLRPDHAYFR